MGLKKINNTSCSHISVYCSESDLYDVQLLHIANKGGLLPDDEYNNIMTSLSTVSYEKVKLSHESLSNILENLWGFCNGNYDEELVEQQRSRVGNKLVINQMRYMGVERWDKDWLEGGMASDAVRTFVKHGEDLR